MLQATVRIRTLVPDDLPGVAALLMRVNPGHAWPSAQACEGYLREILFDHPWRDLALPSWVAEEGARLCGLYAVLPRRMRLRQRTIRVAVGCQFVVDAQPQHGLAALQLARACLTGPQDLTIVDGANDTARRLFAGFGLTAPWAYNLHWTRPLRPMRFALALLGRGAANGAALALARPLADGLDRLATRLRPNRFLRDGDECVETDLAAADIVARLDEFSAGRALRPDYDASSLAWLLGQTARQTARGQLRGRAVRDPHGDLLGWYLHFVRASAPSEVVQLAARGGAEDVTLRCLLADAWRQGATAAHGRFDASFAAGLSRHHCWLRAEGPWMAFHSRDPEVDAALQQGDAFFSRLDGEWWLGFQGR